MFGEDISTRIAFGEALLEAAKEDDRIVFLSADSGASMGGTPMQKEMPARVYNMGIAEQNTMNVAAGMATLGIRPVVGGYAPFMTMRALEQFRTFIAYPHLNVLVAGGMGGLSASTEGVTHSGLEDYGIMRSLPGVIVAVPCDSVSARAISRVLLENEDGPAYIRLGKGAFKKVYEEGEYKFEIGRANLLLDGTDATIIACGPVIPNAWIACDELRREGLNIRLLDMASIKPIDKDAIIAAAKETGAIVTVEDHQIINGLGSAVAEVVVENCPVPMRRVGIPDVFTQSGDHFVLMDHYGLGVESIIKAAREAIAAK